MSTASTGSDAQLDRAALAALYEETFKNLEEGTITEGRVVALTDSLECYNYSSLFDQKHNA